jgi:glyoxylase-like metal-dependent hydrolase (beta-lactamase superfamily II)
MTPLLLFLLLDPQITNGPVNGALIHHSGHTLAIYQDPTGKAEKLLLTHLRRDVVLSTKSSELIHPAQTDPPPVLFHDYANQSTKVLPAPLGGRTVAEPDTIDFHGLTIKVLDTPGYTRTAVSYLFTLEGKRIAATGDLIYGDGQLLDLYSLQDAIPETNEDGYHGYGARAGQLISSLRKIAATHPDLLIPARGPVIQNPQAAIDKLISRLQAVFASHYSIDALRWYRGDDKLKLQAARILGDKPVNWMPMAETKDPPAWIKVINNTRVILSSSGAAFLIDCGNRRILDQVKQSCPRVEGIWITHYHDDHTNFAQTAAEELNTRVYATPELRGILEHPSWWHMPCLTPNPILHVETLPQAAITHWHEFQFMDFYFPGQTLYHDALLIKKDNAESVLFVGDSFTPSGIDDYCLLNRNFTAPEPGFDDCLRLIERLKPDWLINQHVNPMFHFSVSQHVTMRANLAARNPLLAALFPFDDPNYGIDEQWARLTPYNNEARPGDRIELKAVILNHSPVAHRFRVTPHVPKGWTAPPSVEAVIAPRQTAELPIPVTVGPKTDAPITADVAFDKWDFRSWMEARIVEAQH